MGDEGAEPRVGRSSVSAVILAFNRPRHLATVLEQLVALPIDETIIVDNGFSDTGVDLLSDRHDVRLIRPGRNLGAAGRNLAAVQAAGEFLLNLDDDSFPRAGAVEACVQALEENPRVAVVSGLVRDVDEDGNVVQLDEVGTFDWFFRGGRGGESPPGGFPTFFFAEGASMIRKSAFLEAGGFLEPFFVNGVEVEFATRLIAKGWEIRYLPAAVFDHMKAQGNVSANPSMQKYRIRNQLWYFWLHFPTGLAARRMATYLTFDLIECTYRRNLSAWWRGVTEAWRDRDKVRSHRQPLPRAVLRRAELNRGRLHMRLLWAQLLARFAGRRNRDRR